MVKSNYFIFFFLLIFTGCDSDIIDNTDPGEEMPDPSITLNIVNDYFNPNLENNALLHDQDGNFLAVVEVMNRSTFKFDIPENSDYVFLSLIEKNDNFQPGVTANTFLVKEGMEIKLGVKPGKNIYSEEVRLNYSVDFVGVIRGNAKKLANSNNRIHLEPHYFPFNPLLTFTLPPAYNYWTYLNSLLPAEYAGELMDNASEKPLLEKTFIFSTPAFISTALLAKRTDVDDTFQHINYASNDPAGNSNKLYYPQLDYSDFLHISSIAIQDTNYTVFEKFDADVIAFVTPELNFECQLSETQALHLLKQGKGQHFEITLKEYVANNFNLSWSLYGSFGQSDAIDFNLPDLEPYFSTFTDTYNVNDLFLYNSGIYHTDQEWSTAAFFEFKKDGIYGVYEVPSKIEAKFIQ